jgi:Na+-driven multidrug efflux pump
MVGRLGTQQLGAVSVASMCVSFSTFLFSFLIFLTTPEIAGAAVRKDNVEVRASACGLCVLRRGGEAPLQCSHLRTHCVTG